MNIWFRFLGFALLGFVIGQDFTGVSVALGKIQLQTQGTFTSTIWVIYLYLLTITVALPVFNLIRPSLSEHRLFMLGGIGLCIGIFFTMRTSTIWILLTARVIEGFGIAALLPGIWHWILNYFRDHPSQEFRPFILLTTLGIGVGPLIAAAGMSNLDGAAFVNTLMFLLAVLGTSLSLIGASKETPTVDIPIPYFRALSLAGMLIFLIVPLLLNGAWGWFSVNALICYAIAIAFAAFYFLGEWTSGTPVYGLRTLIQPEYLSRSILCFISGWMISTILITFPLYALSILHELPFIVFLTMLSITVTQFVTYHVSRLYDDIFDNQLSIMMSFGGYALSLFLLLFVDADSSLIYVFIALIPAGISWGISTKIITETNDASSNQDSALSSASSLLITNVSFGALTGTALSFAIFKICQKTYVLEKVSSGKLLLPVDLSSPTTGVTQQLLDLLNVEKLIQHLPSHTIDQFVLILNDAGTYGVRRLALFMIFACGLGYIATFLIQKMMPKRY